MRVIIARRFFLFFFFFLGGGGVDIDLHILCTDSFKKRTQPCLGVTGFSLLELYLAICCGKSCLAAKAKPK